MSPELETMCNAMFNGAVPDLWAAVAYPSLKPLGAWVNDLLTRLAFLQRWLMHSLALVLQVFAIFYRLRI